MKKIILLLTLIMFYKLDLKAQVFAFITDSMGKYEYNAETKKWSETESDVPAKITFLINEEGKKLSILFIDPSEKSALFKIKESNVEETGVWKILAYNAESDSASESEIIILLDPKGHNVKVVSKTEGKLVMYRHRLSKVNKLD